MSEPIWLTEAEVAGVMDIGEAIVALESGLRREAAGDAINMVKTHAIWAGRNTLHAIGAVFTADGVVGTKTWAHTTGGATPLLILFDTETGALLAVIEAFVLGQLRTGGISGVATKWLAAADADDMALIGTGKQAAPQLAAVAAVRRLKRVRVWGRDPAKRAAFVQRMRSELDLPVEEAASVAAAVNGASIVTLVTRATEPFLEPAMVASGAHINAVGAITPERMEFVPQIFERCSRAVVDSPPQVQKLSSEFRSYFGEDWSRVERLSDVVAAARVPAERGDITLFKAMGAGISDLSLGVELLRRARAGGLGRPFAAPHEVPPVLRPRVGRI